MSAPLLSVITGTSATTITLGCSSPCPKCSATERVTEEFHGHWATYCASCGDEI